MKLLVVLAFMSVVAAAPPVPSTPEVKILRYKNENDGLGNFKYGFELSDHTIQDVQGELKNPGKENEALTVKGSNLWVDSDGIAYSVNYVADENGYRPSVEMNLWLNKAPLSPIPL